MHAAIPETIASPDADESEDVFTRRMETHYPRLTPAAQRVARHVDQNRLAVLSTSAADIGAAIGASDATVVRAVKALGFDGLADLRQALAASLEPGPTPADRLRRTADEIGEGVEQAVSSVIDIHLESLKALAEPGVQQALVRAIRVLNGADRIRVFGMGPSSALAEYVAMLMTRHGRGARVLNAAGSGLADQLLDLRSGDALLVLAYGRTYREVVVTFDEARRLRLPVVLVTDGLATRLARHADVVVPARRGKQGRVALHGVTVIVLEAIVLGLAVVDSKRAINTLARLGELRNQLLKG